MPAVSYEREYSVIQDLWQERSKVMNDFMSTEQLQGLVERRKLLHGEWLGPTPEQEREAEIARRYHDQPILPPYEG
jgi:hypothetical protein